MFSEARTVCFARYDVSIAPGFAFIANWHIPTCLKRSTTEQT